MDYAHAVVAKNLKEIPFKKDGVDYVWMIVPNNEKDLANYKREYKKYNRVFYDSTSQEFCTDGEYTLLEFEMIRDK